MDSNKIHFKSLFIQYKQIVLHFHRNFTTAHSTTSTRTNFFIRVGSERPEIYGKIYGYGECGLPPKKPGCYMSDMNDCLNFMTQLENIKDVQKNQQSEISKMISDILKPLQSSLKNQIQQLLQYLQQFTITQHFRAPKSCLQFALLDLLTKYHQTTLKALLFPTPPQPLSPNPPRSFYTASLQPNQSMLQNAKSHLHLTTCIKFKYSNDIDSLMELLAGVRDGAIGEKIIVDANCSWTVADFGKFQGKLGDSSFGGLKGKILYVQQPFDLEVSDLGKWEEIKQKTSLKILADESFRTESDLPKIKKIAHAVNIKTQKTGGVFATLKAALSAKQQGLQVMFGSMCSTQLGCTQTFQFHPLAEYLDIDGALLIKEPEVLGGFLWEEGGVVREVGDGFGLGVRCEKLFQE